MKTSKDFKKQAKIIAEITDREEADKLAEKYAYEFKKQNVNFNFRKFYDACNSRIR